MYSTLITISIVLGILFVFIILFVLLHKRGHNRKLVQQNVIFTNAVYQNKLDISEKETVNGHMLAIDRTNFTLLYINFRGPKEEVFLTDLWQIQTVKVTAEDNAVYEQRKGKSVLVDKQVIKLQLELAFVDSQPKANLVLYEYKDGMQDFVHIKGRADYWSSLINKEIKELPRSLKKKVGAV